MPPTTPVTLSAFSSSASSEPNWPSHLTAVFSPTFGHAGQVVARLADERGDVGILLGPHAVALDDGVAVVALELRDALHVRVEQRDVVVHELDRVAVARADEHVEALLGALRREGREDVVGLDVLLLQDR